MFYISEWCLALYARYAEDKLTLKKGVTHWFENTFWRIALASFVT